MDETIKNVDATEATLQPIIDVKHYTIDKDGNRVEVEETEVLGYVQEGEGEIAGDVAAN